VKYVTAVEKSSNRKIGDVSATYVAQTSCPITCSFLNNGCYAENSFVGYTTRRLNRAAVEARATPLDIAKAEHKAILELSGKRPLRLHVVGDCVNNNCAWLVSQACDVYTKRHNQPVWSYTHAWRSVDKEAWGGVSVLASCETPLDVAEAHAKGYATALVVEEHQSESLYQDDTVSIIPCPQQTRGKTCEECRLCFKGDFLQGNERTIAFAAHGATKLIGNALKQRRGAEPLRAKARKAA